MKSLSALLLALAATNANAIEPDFYILAQSCKTTIGYLVLSEESLKTVQGDPATFGCMRLGSEMLCAFAFEGGLRGHKGNAVTYNVDLDSPPHLFLSDAKGSELISINTQVRAAVIVTRVAGIEYLGAKVCHGIYATASDVEALERAE